MYKQYIIPYAKNSVIEYKDYVQVGRRVFFGDNVLIRCNSAFIGEDTKFGSDIQIYSMKVLIGARTTFGYGSKIIAYEKLKIGNDCRIRPRVNFKARTIEIGDHFYSNDNPLPLIIGGGGSDSPTAHIKIGKRCVMHDSFINVCMPVTIGDDVGLSPSSSIITHGFWNSVIEGYSCKHAGVTIGNGTIVGYGATILMGVELGSYVSVAAKAVVTKSFPPNCVIGGVPAKIIKKTRTKLMSITDKREKMKEILREYASLLKDKMDEVELSEIGPRKLLIIHGKYNNNNFRIVLGRPYFVRVLSETRTIVLMFGNITPLPNRYYLINLSDSTWVGEEDEITDDLRDFLRKRGIRIFSKRWFKSIQNKFKRRLGC